MKKSKLSAGEQQLRNEARTKRTKKRKEKLKIQVEKRTVHLGERVDQLKKQLINTQRELTTAFNKIEELTAKLPKHESQEKKDAAK